MNTLGAYAIRCNACDRFGDGKNGKQEKQQQQQQQTSAKDAKVIKE